MSNSTHVQRKFETLAPFLDERLQRLWAAAEAEVLGRGGVTLVARATGLSRPTVQAGLRELHALRVNPEARLPVGRVRRAGGGRKPLQHAIPTLLADLESLLDPPADAAADAPLRWTCKGTVRLADELRALGRPVSPRTVAGLLRELGCHMQTGRSPADRPGTDRNARFDHINALAREFLQRGRPFLALDARKKVRSGVVLGSPGAGDRASGGDWELIEIDHETAAFTAASLRRWWRRLGAAAYPDAATLGVAVSGGSPPLLWDEALRELADDLGLELCVLHLPPGTSKWACVQERLCWRMTTTCTDGPTAWHEATIEWIGLPSAANGHAGLPHSLHETNNEDTAAAWKYTILPAEN